MTSTTLSLGLFGISVLLVAWGAMRQARERCGRWVDLRALGICAVAVLVATGLVYRTMARADANLPHFQVEMDDVIAFSTDEVPEPGVLTVASITNRGADGQAMGIGLSARLGRDNKDVGSKPQEMSERFPIRFPDGSVTYFGENDLATMVESSPLKHGQVVYGVMLYSLPGLSIEELKDERTTYRLAVRDAEKTTYSRRFPATNMPRSVNDLRHFPGIRMEIKYESTGKTVRLQR